MSGYSKDEIQDIMLHYGDMVYRLAFIKMKTRSNADDVYQEVFLKLIKQTKKHENPEHLRYWLLKTTINCCKDTWKSFWNKNIILTEDDLNTEAANDNSLSYVSNCVLRLPEKYRELIHLYYFEGYSIREISAILKRSENTISSQLSRGRALLKKMFISERGFDYEI